MASEPHAGRWLVVTGLAAEMQLLDGLPVDGIASYGAYFDMHASTVETNRPAAVLSFGLCGGLDPALRPGDLVLASTLATATDRLTLPDALVSRLHSLLPAAHRGAMFAAREPLATVADKQAAFAATGAAAADMESMTAARMASAWGVPFAAVRAVADPAEAALPSLARHAIGPDGRMQWRAVLADLFRHPGQIPAVIATGRHASAAMRALNGARPAIAQVMGGE
jgi:hypothetical protein